MAISFLDPRGESAVEPTPYDLSTRLDPGVTVGLLANGFPDSVEFLDAVGEAITARRPASAGPFKNLSKNLKRTKPRVTCQRAACGLCAG